MRSGIPPWHMWGNTQQITTRQQGGAVSPLVGTVGQLVKISYLRPESWHWVFSARLIQAPDTTAIGEHVSITVDFDLTLGIGRTVIQIPRFEHYLFNWNDGVAAPLGHQIWSSQVLSPIKLFQLPAVADTSDRNVDMIVAQDIQLQATVTVQYLSIANQDSIVEVAAQFSPKTHVRPEWFKDGRYPGAEDGGGEQGSVTGQMEQLNKPSANPDEAQAFAEYYAQLSPEQLAAEERQEYVEEMDRLDDHHPVARTQRHNPRRLG